MFLDTIFVLGLLFTEASQLRPDGLSLGPGELCLAIWVIWRLIGAIIGSDLEMTGAFLRLIIFWCIFGLALCIGT